MNSWRSPTTSSHASRGRRTVAVVIGLAPIALAVASLVVPPRPAASYVFGLLLGGAAIAAFNVYLSFIRPRLYKRRHGTLDGYRFVSGAPMIGSALVVIAWASSMGSRSVAVSSLLILAVDTGGLPWFASALWKD